MNCISVICTYKNGITTYARFSLGQRVKLFAFTQLKLKKTMAKKDRISLVPIIYFTEEMSRKKLLSSEKKQGKKLEISLFIIYQDANIDILNN